MHCIWTSFFCLLCVAFAPVVAGQSACGQVGGSCVATSIADTACAAGDLKTDGDMSCPVGTSCCLPVGSLCQLRGGTCRPSSLCGNGMLIANGYTCAQDTVCCLEDAPLHVQSNAKAKSVGLDHVITQQAQPSDDGNLLLSILFPTLFFIVSGGTLFYISDAPPKVFKPKPARR